MKRGRKKIYTQQFITRELEWFLQQLKRDKENEIIFLAQLFEDKPYSCQRYSEWRKDFQDNEEIQDLMAKINEILETRVVVGAMRKNLDSSFTKFVLINNYSDKYSERQDTNLQITVDMAERMRNADARLKQLGNGKPLQIENQKNEE